MHRAIIFLLFIGLTTLFGCKDNGVSTEKIKTAAGLPPIAGVASVIAGDRAEVISVLPPGRTPHDFSLRTQTIRQISGSSVFFSTGMPFEKKIAESLEPSCLISDVTEGISRIKFTDGGDHDHHHHDGCTHDDHDPHVWLSPENALKIAENILKDLSAADPDNAEYYRKNFESLKNRLTAVNEKLSDSLAEFKGRTFFVYHPAFGYFAKAYGLHQRAIELNGREASPQQIARIIKEAEAADAHTVFVQEQFNPGSAQTIAKEINGTVSTLDPLAEDLVGNLEKIGESLVSGFLKKTGK